MRLAIDVPGQLLAIVGLAALTLALAEAGVLCWSAPIVVVIALGAGGTISGLGTTGRSSRCPAFDEPWP